MKQIAVLLVFLLWLTGAVLSQHTMGLTSISPNSYSGYTLFAPVFNTSTYLVDNCGNRVHEWQSTYQPAAAVYFLENGNLLRTGATNNVSFAAAGSGGIIEVMDWNSNIIWTVEYSSNNYCLHHDVEYLPNGNILAIAWILKTPAQALALGRDPSKIPADGVWFEQIVEFAMTSSVTADIVWEWNVEDHLIQDIDSTKANYGVVADHPEKIDVNYIVGAPGNYKDWIHLNAIDYNVDLDQIVVSGVKFKEIWVIDHSTTMQESAAAKGGTYGHGGDLLYRWGNPVAYKRGVVADKKLYGVHDVQWIKSDCPDAGKILMFNNGNGRAEGNYSSVDIIDQPVDSMGFYHIGLIQPYGPDLLHSTYNQLGLPDPFHTQHMGGASQLPNGNIIACESSSGHFIEVTPSKQIVWDYINPVNALGPMTQGAIPSGNLVFRAIRIPANYPGLAEKDFDIPTPIELLPLPSLCDSTIITGIESAYMLPDISLLNNPVTQVLTIQNGSSERLSLELYNHLGALQIRTESNEENVRVDVESLSRGVYFIRMIGQTSFKQKSIPFVKI